MQYTVNSVPEEFVTSLNVNTTIDTYDPHGQYILRAAWDMFNNWRRQWHYRDLTEKEQLKLYERLTGITIIGHPEFRS
jgi:hypothetical protein